MIEETKNVLANIEKEAEDKRYYHDFKYLNYAASFLDPIGSYDGATAIQNLKAASKKYDPDGLFQIGVPGEFKLFT